MSFYPMPSAVSELGQPVAPAVEQSGNHVSQLAALKSSRFLGKGTTISVFERRVRLAADVHIGKGAVPRVRSFAEWVLVSAIATSVACGGSATTSVTSPSAVGHALPAELRCHAAGLRCLRRHQLGRRDRGEGMSVVCVFGSGMGRHYRWGAGPGRRERHLRRRRQSRSDRAAGHADDRRRPCRADPTGRCRVALT